jgi:hypothetical protein
MMIWRTSPKLSSGVDFSKPERVASATRFKDAINDWFSLEDDTYFKWQKFIRCYGSPVEIKSDSWFKDTLLLSMDKTLHAEVESDISHISSSKHGSITTLRFINRHMVIKNQESLDTLKDNIKTFDITKFPVENFPVACLRFKAVAKALGTDALPKISFAKFLKVSPNCLPSLLMKFVQARLLCIAAVSFKRTLKIDRNCACSQ